MLPCYSVLLEYYRMPQGTTVVLESRAVQSQSTIAGNDKKKYNVSQNSAGSLRSYIGVPQEYYKYNRRAGVLQEHT